MAMKHSLIWLILSLSPLLATAQVNNGFNAARQQVGGSNASAFNRNRASNFNDYRQKLNAEYVSKTREPWKGFNSFRGMTDPEKNVKPVAPVRMPEADVDKEKENKQLDIKDIATPIHQTTPPQPVAPIQEQQEPQGEMLRFSYLGTPLQVRKPQCTPFTLSGISENAVANAWEQLCKDSYNNMLVDCMRLRGKLKLCDWAYLMMLKEVGQAYCSNANAAMLLTAFLYSQSGYKMRLGVRDGALEMLYASQHQIYETPYIQMDGDNYYPLSRKQGQVKVNAAKYPKEQSMSLWVSSDPLVQYQASPQRTLQSERYHDMSITVSANKNLLPFFSSYPSSEVGGNFMTRWAMYANTPLCQEVRQQLYPQLKNAIANRSQLEAVNRLLNWVQTAFVYEYDDKVWGGDRAFFAEETLYYPYCDCEDRSILFTRLVRDLLGLRCVLIYYPGHLASAVCMTEEVNGDYILLSGQKYIVCDPTYIGAPVGSTMPNMDNSQAKVILLQ